MKTLDRRGQVFTTDLIFSVTIFLFVLTLMLVYSQQVAVRVGYWELANERENAALLASRALVLSPGEPANWELLAVEDINSIGLADSRNMLSSEKVQRLSDLNAANYEEAKALLGLAKYDAWVEIRDLNKVLLDAFGNEPDSNKEVSGFTRAAFYEGEPVLLKVKVFE